MKREAGRKTKRNRKLGKQRLRDRVEARQSETRTEREQYYINTLLENGKKLRGK